MQQPAQDQLRTLAIFYYVVAGIAALVACIPVIHLIIGLTMIFSPETFGGENGSDLPPPWLGALFAGIGGGLILLGWMFSICLLIAGRCLSHQRRYTFCLVMGAIACLFMPLGTVLGIFTIITLGKPEVKALFPQTSRPLNAA